MSAVSWANVDGKQIRIPEGFYFNSSVSKKSKKAGIGEKSQNLFFRGEFSTYCKLKFFTTKIKENYFIKSHPHIHFEQKNFGPKLEKSPVT